MSNVVEFPAADEHQWTEAEIDKLHGEAFRDLEMSLRDCVKMSGIAAQLMLYVTTEDSSLNFAVMHTAEMLMRLEKEYDARWHGELK